MPGPMSAPGGWPRYAVFGRGLEHMPNREPIPSTLSEYVTRAIAGLPPAARLVVVFDPDADLALGETFEIEETGQTWRVMRYDGNDLAFRQGYRPGRHDLVWVTCPPGWLRESPLRIAPFAAGRAVGGGRAGPQGRRQGHR